MGNLRKLVDTPRLQRWLGRRHQRAQQEPYQKMCPCLTVPERSERCGCTKTPGIRSTLTGRVEASDRNEAQGAYCTWRKGEALETTPMRRFDGGQDSAIRGQQRMRPSEKAVLAEIAKSLR